MRYPTYVGAHLREAVEEPKEQEHPKVLNERGQDAHDAVHQQSSY